MESLVIFIIFCFTCYSFVNMLLYFSGPFGVFEHIRNIAGKISPRMGELFSCPACASTWVSFFLSALMLVFYLAFSIIGGISNVTVVSQDYDTFGLWWLIILLDGLCGSGTTWLLFKFEDFLVSNTKPEVTQIEEDNIEDIKLIHED